MPGVIKRPGIFDEVHFLTKIMPFMKSQTIRITMAAVLFCTLQASVALPNAADSNTTADSARAATPAKVVPASQKPAVKKVIDAKKTQPVPQYQWFYLPKTKKDNC